jgi:hypothetical protein
MSKDQNADTGFSHETATYAAICKALRDHSTSYGDKPPLILFDDDDGPVAFEIDEAGHMHRVHRQLAWQATAPQDNVDFI